MLTALGADKVIDYRVQKWWESAEFIKDPFDVIIDCAEGLPAWNRCCAVLKPGWAGGRFVAVTPEDPTLPDGIKGNSIRGVLYYFAVILFRKLKNRISPMNIPKYMSYQGDVTARQMEKLVALVDSGHLKPMIDPRCPKAFSLDGVKEAFHLVQSRRAHGKVVVEIASEPQCDIHD